MLSEAQIQILIYIHAGLGGLGLLDIFNKKIA
jgi:hypothetical protein